MNEPTPPGRRRVGSGHGAGHGAGHTTGHTAGHTGEDMTRDDLRGRCQQVAAILITTYEDLDRLDRVLGGTTATGPVAAPVEPSPPTRAALVTALQVVDIVNGNLQERDFAGITVLERVQANLHAVMGTLGALLCDLTLPGSLPGSVPGSLPAASSQVDLAAVVEQARAVLDAFSADPAALPLPVAGR